MSIRNHLNLYFITLFVDPVIEDALIKLAEMGYCSRGTLFADLLESVDGDIIRFFERYEIDQIFD